MSTTISTSGHGSISYTEHSRRLEDGEAATFVLLFVLIVILCVINCHEANPIQLFYLFYFGDRLQGEEQADIEAPPIAVSTAPLGSAVTAARPRDTPRAALHELSVRELTVIYSEAFQKSHRQTVLLPSDIFHWNPTKKAPDTESKDEEKAVKDEEQSPFDWSLIKSIRDHSDDPSIDAALQSTRSIRQNTKTNTDAAAAADDDNSAIVPQNEQSSRHKSTYIVHPERQELAVVGGTCLICLEEMKVGETVVWSKTESCPHMYHKDCLVSFLAHNCKGQARLPPSRRKEGHDPCPACRQNFVTVQEGGVPPSPGYS